MREYAATMDQRMFDFQSFYLTIAAQLSEDATIAEVGVGNGASAIFLAEAMLNLGKNKFKLLMVDNMDYGGPDQLQVIIKHLGAAELTEFVDILSMDSLNASCRFPDVHFDFVFVDASHRFELTKADIRLWYHKLKEGGILAGHDYNGTEGEQVKAAVDLVVPDFVIRAPIPGQVFPAEKVRQVEETTNQCGVWWLKSRFYLKLN